MINPDHLCRAEHQCRGRRRDVESGDWLPALTLTPNTLCHSCVLWVEGAVAQLGTEHDALQALFLDPSARPGGGVKAASPAPAVPINVYTDALAQDIRETVHRCAELICEAIRRDTPESVYFGSHYSIVADNVDVLLAIPSHETTEWNRAGDDWIYVVHDGPTLALKLVDLHRRARATIGQERGRDRMPLPCPRCEEHQLGRWHGSVTVDCLACGSRWAESDYKQMTLVLAATPGLAPPPRIRHLASNYGRTNRMTDILEFLRARLDDEEAIANAARPGPWQFVEDAINGPRIGDEEALMIPEDHLAPCNDSIPPEDSRHIAHHDPARVLRDVAAKRATLDTLFAADLRPTQWSIFAKVIEPMAAVYSDHPDYQKEWTL
ncbi:hypothetical protein G8767_17155 [Rhodococcus sp. IC4_135]|uniref:DUF6221 family protein n=1 Tax=Rhodococcus sp. IC4_135 TaxID=2715537 RepID=UPI0014214E9E|nr:hypothetical protein [Rhodococcus sp. IC4_135]